MLPATTRPTSPRRVFSPSPFRNTADMVPVKPICSSPIAPSDTVTSLQPANSTRFQIAATSSWSRLMRSSASRV